MRLVAGYDTNSELFDRAQPPNTADESIATAQQAHDRIATLREEIRQVEPKYFELRTKWRQGPANNYYNSAIWHQHREIRRLLHDLDVLRADAYQRFSTAQVGRVGVLEQDAKNTAGKWADREAP
jgi:hypothetical protein